MKVPAVEEAEDQGRVLRTTTRREDAAQRDATRADATRVERRGEWSAKKRNVRTEEMTMAQYMGWLWLRACTNDVDVVVTDPRDDGMG